MINKSKLGQLLQKIPAKEYKNIRKYLASPFFNQRNDLCNLFEGLIVALENQGLELKNEALHHRVFPDEPYKARDFHLRMSYLFRQLEQYLSISAFQDDPMAGKLQLLQAYRNRGLHRHHEQTLRKARKALEKESYRHADHYEQLNAVSWEGYQLQLLTKPSDPLPLEEWSQLTDLAFFSDKLRQLCVLTAHQTVYSAQYESIREFREVFFPYLEKRDLIRIPAIGIYYHGFFILQNEAGDQHFPAFRRLLLTHSRDFPQEELRQLYQMAINYCVGRVNRGEQDYFIEMSDLYREGLTQKILLDKNRLSRFAYFNAVAAAIQTASFAWAEELIEAYQQFLDPKHRQSAYSYSRAKLAYETGDYDRALSLIHQTRFKDVLLNLAAKTISLKIYFALENFDLLDAHVNAMNNYIRRNRLIGYHRRNYLNLLRLTRKILALNPYNQEAIQALRKQIEDTEPLTEKDWLLGVI